MSLTEAQREAAHAKCSVAVIAGAGTGKTHMLAERYLHELADLGLSPLELVAVTFTEKAAGELRSRIRALAFERDHEAADIHAELEAAPISTLHALAARICREHPEAAGVAADFAILDDRADGQLWLAEQLSAALDLLDESLYAEIPYSLLRQALEALLDDPLIAEEALARQASDVGALAREARDHALATMLDDPNWAAARSAIFRLAGPAGDARELTRTEAQTAMRELEAARANGSEALQAIEMLKAINLRGGSKKAWGEAAFEEAKAALEAVRKLARENPLLLAAPGDADARMATLSPALGDAYALVSERLTDAKRAARILTFADLEVHALRALADPAVQAYYAARWKACLIDEFQDTNPIQARLLQALVSQARLTIVGDEKQAIYGFRRADVRVFQAFRERLATSGGQEVQLSRSFRTHHGLIEAINAIFAPLLGVLHQPLEAERQSTPAAGPHVRLLTIQPEKGYDAEAHRWVEAHRLAREIKRLVEAQTPVWDKDTKAYRPATYGDVAILCRASAPLALYGEALAAEGVPNLLARGGNLLETREALDAYALLRFLAEPHDDLALVAVLRSPFFGIGDPVLFRFSQGLKGIRWWLGLQESRPEELEHPFAVLSALLAQRRKESPSRLLQLADQHCGYTAVLANLPGARRREADWRGFLEFLRGFEAGAQDVFTVVRRLQVQMASGIELERPPLEADGVVALMTIHASKGLEWPIVAVANLSGQEPRDARRIYFDETLGIGLKLDDDDGNAQEPLVFQLLKQQRKALEADELRRVYYVALTRARDQLLLSAPNSQGGPLDVLLPGLEAAAVMPEEQPFAPADAVAPQLPAVDRLPVPHRYLLSPVSVEIAL